MDFFTNLGKGFSDLFTKGDPSSLGQTFGKIIKGGAHILSDPAVAPLLMAVAPELSPEIILATEAAHGINNTNLF
jgi:hypothetical protein